MCVIKSPGRRERENVRSNIWRDNSWEFSKSDQRHHHTTNSRSLIQIPSRINKKKSTLRHISFKRLLKTKDEEKILKAARGAKKMDYLKNRSWNQAFSWPSISKNGNQKAIRLHLQLVKRTQVPIYKSSALSAILCCHPSFHFLVASRARQTWVQMLAIGCQASAIFPYNTEEKNLIENV